MLKLLLLVVGIMGTTFAAADEVLICNLSFTDMYRDTRHKNGDPRVTSQIISGTRGEVVEQAKRLRENHDAAIQKSVAKQKRGGYDSGFKSELNCGSIELSEKVDF